MKISFQQFTHRIWPLILVLAALAGLTPTARAFVHPGGLHNQADLDRMKTQVAAGAHPWIDGWNNLLADTGSLLSYGNHATANMGSSRQNASRDAHVAYNAVIRWYVSGDTAYADKAVEICNAWSAVVNQVPTGTDIPGLSGIPIAEFAQVAEILRIYPGWATADFDRFKNMMLTYWYPVCQDFLVNHAGACDTHFWANWDAANLSAILSIGVLCDDQAKFDEAVTYFQGGGVGNGNIYKAVPMIHPNGLGQWQESGRDQEHAQLGVGLLGAMCEVAWHQGVDLYGTATNRLLAGADYVARTNLSEPVPYTFYNNCDNVNQYYLSINGIGRIDDRPVWEMIYNHYVVRQGLSAPNVKAMAQATRPEHGSADHFGYGTLTFTLDAAASTFPSAPPQAVTNLTATSGVSHLELKWTPPADDTTQGYQIQRAITPGGPYTTIASWTANTWPEYWDWSVTNGTTYYYVVAPINQSGTGAASTEVSATPLAAVATMPAGWAQSDVGTVITAGSATYSSAGGNTFNVVGSGSNVGGTADSIGFTGASASGDLTFVARLSGMGGALGKTGIMIRESLAPEAPMIFLKRGDVGWREAGVAIRSAAGADSAWVAGNDYTWLSTWFKIQRVGNTFTAYQSNDGVEWFAVASATLSMGQSCYVGFAVCTGSATGATGSGTFDHVTVTGGGAAPVAPATLTATGVGSRQIDLSWSASSGASAYTLKRSASSGGPFVTIASNLSGTSYSDTGLEWQTTYYYVVSAGNVVGDSPQSAIASATTLSPDIPATTTGLFAAAGDARVHLSWGSVHDATSYNVKRATTSGGPYSTLASVAGLDYDDLTAANGTTYYYVVSAANVVGAGPDSAQVSATPAVGAYSYWPFNETSGTTAADVWSGRNGTLASGASFVAGAINNGVHLDGSSGAYVTLPTGVVSSLTDFTISAWVKLDTLNNWARLFDFGTSATTPNNYMFLSPRSGASGNRVRYAIRTPSVTERIIDGPTLTAGAWAHLAVTQSGSTAILYVNGLEVGRNTAMTLNPASLGSTNQNYIGKSQWNDPLLNGVVDDFRIYSRGLSAAEISAIFNTTAPDAPTNVAASGTANNVTVSWTASTEASSYTVKRSTSATGTFTAIATGVAGTSYTDTTAAFGPFYYLVTAQAGAFESNPSNIASIVLPPAPPAAPVATGWNNRVDLSWAATTGATGYDVKRATTSGGPYTTITSTTSTLYSDASVANGTTYYYVVAATNAAGSSANSSEASVTPADSPALTGFTHQDIGLVGIVGNAGYGAGVYSLYGSGADIWGTSDGFHFMSQTLNGDGAIVARVLGIDNTQVSAKAGVMMRESLATNSRHATADLTPGNVVEFIRRTSTGGSSASNSTAGLAAPRWVRLVRAAGSFSAFQSSDGVSWTAVGTAQAISMTTSIKVGLVVTSHDNTKLARGQFDHVNIASVLPAITSATTASGTYGAPFSYAITATNAPYLYTASGLPAGLTLDADTGMISGTPAAAGTFSVTLGANNAMGTGTAGLTITIAKAAATVTLGDLNQVYNGTPLSATATTAPANLTVDFTYDGSSTPPTNAGSFAVVATVNDVNYAGSAADTLVITKAPATVTLGNLSQTYDGSPKLATATTAPVGLAASLTYDGSATAPINAGNYAVVGTIVDANYVGSANGTLVIGKALATVTLGALSQTYDASPKPVSVTTAPAGLPVVVAYNGSATAPTNAGSYVVSAIVSHQNYAGSASGTLVIGKAVATIALAPLAQGYDGLAKTVTATPTPAGLTVNLTYDGAAAGSIYPGPHTVVATIDDPNYSGTKTETLVISVSVLVRHAPAISSIVDGSVQVLLPESFTLKGGSTLSGDLLVPGTPTIQVNGSPTYGVKDGVGSATPTNYTLTLGGGAVVRYIVRHVDAIVLPTVAAPPAPAGTRNITIKTAGQTAGDFATLRNLTLNTGVGNVAVPPGTYGSFTANSGAGFVLGVAGATEPAIYNLQSLTLNSSSTLQVVGPVILTLASGPTISGTAGNGDHPEWLALNVYSGGVTLNIGATLRAIVTAPSGTVTLNDSATFTGRVTADRFTLNTNALLDGVAP